MGTSRVFGQGREPGDYTNSQWSFEFALGGGQAKVHIGQPDNAFLNFAVLESLFGARSQRSASGSSTTSAYAWSLLGGLGSGFRPVSSTSYRLHMERTTEGGYLGFRFGTTSYNISLPADNSDFNAVIPLLVLAAGTGPSTTSANGNPYSDPLELLLVRNPYNMKSTGVAVPYLDVGFSIHARPKTHVDPYIELGGGVGSCGSPCDAARGFAKIVLRFNIGEGFWFLEQSYDQHRITMGTDGGYRSVLDRGLFLGGGFYL